MWPLTSTRNATADEQDPLCKAEVRVRVPRLHVRISASPTPRCMTVTSIFFSRSRKAFPDRAAVDRWRPVGASHHRSRQNAGDLIRSFRRHPSRRSTMRTAPAPPGGSTHGTQREDGHDDTVSLPAPVAGQVAETVPRRPRPPAKIVHLTRTERVAKGKLARAEAPLGGHADFSPPPTGIRSLYLSRRPPPGCRSWCRSGMGGCSPRRSRSIAALP